MKMVGADYQDMEIHLDTTGEAGIVTANLIKSGIVTLI
jgi:hypothetical protein